MTPAHLPRKAASKFSDLSTAADEADALAKASTRRIDELAKQLNASNTSRKDRANLEHELSRLRANQSRHQSRYHALSALVTAIRDWLETLPTNTVLEDVSSSAAKPRGKETAYDAVFRLRRTMEALRDDLRRAKSAPLPKDDLRKQARDLVTVLAARGAPQISTVGGKLRISFSDPNAYAPPSGDKLLAMLAYLAPDLMTAKFLKLVDLLPTSGNAMSAEHKAAEVAKLTARISDLEWQEEAFIMQCHDGEQDILRRTDAPPAVVLSVSVKRQQTRQSVMAA